MRTLRQTGWVLATTAVVVLAASGCWPFGPRKGSATPPPAPTTAAPAKAATPAKTAKNQPPRDEIDDLLADLDSGVLVRCWRAEEALGDMGASVAVRTRAALGATTPEARGAGCRLAYRFHDVGAVPGMIALLGDESRLVRSAANVFLCGLTGQDFNFRPDALVEDRAAAQAKWKTWYETTPGAVVTPKRP